MGLKENETTKTYTAIINNNYGDCNIIVYSCWIVIMMIIILIAINIMNYNKLSEIE